LRKIAAALAFVPGFALAQTPDVAVFADLRPSWNVEDNRRSQFQWFDLQARYSLVGVRLVLEPGYRVYVAQRIQKITHSGDPDSLDEYYIEDRGRWRLGKQYLPFGTRNLLRETALAARIDTELLFDAVPIQIAYADAGPGRVRGVVARIGGPFGISVAAGNHFGIQATALAQVQLPGDAAGVGRGHRLAFGADATLDLKAAVVTAEWVLLRDGHTSLDSDRSISDLKFTWQLPLTSARVSAAWTREWSAQQDFFRFEAELPFADKIAWIPYLRFDDRRLQDFGLSARIRF